jgi:hypothetical protein
MLRLQPVIQPTLAIGLFLLAVVGLGACSASTENTLVKQTRAWWLPFVSQNTASGPAWHPAPGASWQIQLSGSPDISLEVDWYDLDLFDTSPQVIQALHEEGRKVVCYFSAGSWEEWRPDAEQFPPVVIGNDLQGWPGEKWLDIRRLDLLGPLMVARLELAVQKGCDGVDADNMDGYANATGFALTAQDQLNYNRWMAEQAHLRRLAVGLKNDLEQISELVSYFDWQLNEQCFQYNECDLLLPFIQAGKPVFGLEYQGDLQMVCPQANALNFDVLFKHLELDAWRVSCRDIP